jgi:hypothetical protein
MKVQRKGAAAMRRPSAQTKRAAAAARAKYWKVKEARR